MDISVGEYNEKEVPNNGKPFIADEISLWLKEEHRQEFADQVLAGKTIYLKVRKNKERKAVVKQDGTVLQGLYKIGWLTWFKKDDLPF